VHVSGSSLILSRRMIQAATWRRRTSRQTPPVRPQPDLQRPFSVQPPQQWAPPFATGVSPGATIARCFTDGHDCPLEQNRPRR
jgi:hypothetical protein